MYKWNSTIFKLNTKGSYVCGWILPAQGKHTKQADTISFSSFLWIDYLDCHTSICHNFFSISEYFSSTYGLYRLFDSLLFCFAFIQFCFSVIINSSKLLFHLKYCYQLPNDHDLVILIHYIWRYLDVSILCNKNFLQPRMI